ncbi:MAG: fructosamine kinase family protein [Lachnospiraceae bacterium]|nr:fructosamine kinase family protein [Lachnospiraceae bacterium]
MPIRSYDSIEAGIRGCFAPDVVIKERSYVHGGDINDSFCLHLSNGEDVFVKSNTLSNRGLFDAEETGLFSIASTKAIGTPDLLCKGVDQEKQISFLMMEMIPRMGRIEDYFAVFGRELAAMHLKDTSSFVSDGNYGFNSDNYIGASKQVNTPKDTWTDFFRECRLIPQFRMAKRYFGSTEVKSVIRLLDKLDDILIEPERPSLLHGDLWSGNFITGRDKKAWLIDPAVYVGHAEADIAMTELFGRLPNEFYSEYMSVYPMQPGYPDRRNLYNLYHLLNHLNLFGGSYLPEVINTVRYYTSTR